MLEKRTKNLKLVAAFCILFVFWIVLSGHYDFLHVSIGLVCAALVSYLSSDLLFRDTITKGHVLVAFRFIRYIPWLLYQIFLANLHVVYLVFRPSKINPKFVYFKTNLKSELSKVTLGNAITLTPGTITVNIKDDEFCVHVLSDKVALELLNGEMERRVEYIFRKSDNNKRLLTGEE